MTAINLYFVKKKAEMINLCVNCDMCLCSANMCDLNVIKLLVVSIIIQQLKNIPATHLDLCVFAKQCWSMSSSSEDQKCQVWSPLG